MKMFMQLPLVLALLASAGVHAQEAGLCKSMCGQEKRSCRVAAAKMIDHEADPIWTPHENNRMARDFASKTSQGHPMIGPEARNVQDRKMTRDRACEDTYMTCTKACPVPAVTSDVLIRPATK
jgi:ferredoxin